MARQAITSCTDVYWVSNAAALNANFVELYGATMTAGTGFPGTGTVYKTSVVKSGDLYVTSLFIDLTGVKASATDLDIIGTAAAEPAHIGQITAAKNGTIVGGKITCLEVPAGAADDIDLYCATTGTGATTYFDAAIASVTGYAALVTSGGAWTSGGAKGFTAVPAADKYLYLVAGEGSANGTYSAGQFLIELYGV
jgi:hypothetical protein